MRSALACWMRRVGSSRRWTRGRHRFGHRRRGRRLPHDCVSEVPGRARHPVGTVQFASSAGSSPRPALKADSQRNPHRRDRSRVSSTGSTPIPPLQAVLRYEPQELVEWITGHLGTTQRMADAAARSDRGGSGGRRRQHPQGRIRDEMSLTLVLVAQTFVFAHRIGSNDAGVARLAWGISHDPSR